MGPANPDFEINIEARNCFATTRSRNAREGGTRRGMRESEKLSNYPSFFARDRWERFRSVVGARARSSLEISKSTISVLPTEKVGKGREKKGEGIVRKREKLTGETR